MPDPACADEARQTRDRMYAALAVRAPSGRFHLKYGAGGEADLDFLVQHMIPCVAAEPLDVTRGRGTRARLVDLSRRGAQASALRGEATPAVVATPFGARHLPTAGTPR